ncbi:SMC-Scp complex subunit ScpB [Amphibacillus xylanus]|uniref:Segregation and condensation protein B n=1 Tax=Amphibacillus xylanus (strain ATCC 51415 / DSM 6626 / JCM 7361 / LMG 17667 / NBRC 15112 / Ep01) TaxID=698758 RepID=K0J7E8_AMPXN|nr:SMC-Scp complex subunit ScpB [Amphibacillus xylanus]BAM47343.1 segregation and condensation protein B [Amphibacillus xylanus NBRC 15112]
MDLSHYKAIVEGLLFVSGSDGLTINQMSSITELDSKTIEHLLNELKFDYENASRGIQILESEKHFYLASKPEHAEYFRKLRADVHTSKLTQASLETLAIIAYNQPITRAEIEEIRGVKSDRPIQTILSRGLIEEVGRKNTIGRPMMFGTTLDFLTYFGLRSIDELPPLNDQINEDEINDEASLYFDKLKDE